MPTEALALLWTCGRGDGMVGYVLQLM
jgi:hypothetical protein